LIAEVFLSALNSLLVFPLNKKSLTLLDTWVTFDFFDRTLNPLENSI